MQKKYKKSLCWVRRDLRYEDQAALYHALQASEIVKVIFVFDEAILAPLRKKNTQDRRVEFIWEQVQALRHTLQEKGSDLIILHGNAREIIPAVAQYEQAEAVFFNHDYEPFAKERDASVSAQLASLGCQIHHYKDHVIFEGNEVLSKQKQAFSVFTPYKKAWLNQLEAENIPYYDTHAFTQFLAPAHNSNFFPKISVQITAFDQLGFEKTDLKTLGYAYGEQGAQQTLKSFLPTLDFYHQQRDFPAQKGTSLLSPHLRFGTISIRVLVQLARQRLDTQQSEGASTWLSELIWRDFFSMILAHFPQVVGHTFRPEFDHIPFPNSERFFQAWCAGKTGYPIVDAAMRQLNHTGWMHNRLRMIVASFLVKDLQVDWRWGEAYFAEKLIDFDLASNNGGWQWAASTGCDAQPYFRIFNPILQSKKFDPEGKFIRQFLPELSYYDRESIHTPWLEPLLFPKEYVFPIVDHAQARESTLALFEVTKNQYVKSK